VTARLDSRFRSRRADGRRWKCWAASARISISRNVGNRPTSAVRPRTMRASCTTVPRQLSDVESDNRLRFGRGWRPALAGARAMHLAPFNESPTCGRARSIAVRFGVKTYKKGVSARADGRKQQLHETGRMASARTPSLRRVRRGSSGGLAPILSTPKCSKRSRRIAATTSTGSGPSCWIRCTGEYQIPPELMRILLTI
jgi:hypothetical protein